MILLRFTVRNHKSLRDEVTVDLTRTSLRTLQPRDGNWTAATYRTCGIFGGNATGKSALLDAMVYAFSAIRDSSTSWQASRTMQRAPFRLDPASREKASTYVLEFVLDGRRHEYGFEVDARGVAREWLRDVPSSRWRMRLERDRDDRVLRPSTQVTDRELVLSRALHFPQSPLHDVARRLVDEFDVVLVKDSYREARLSMIADMLASGAIDVDDLQALLRIADIGVTAVRIEEQDLPQAFRAALAQFHRSLRAADSPADAVEVEPDAEDELDSDDQLDDPVLEQVVRRLLFTHAGADEDCPPFSIQDESDGTVAWLAIAVPALETLRRGGLLVVDELDASLHPHLMDLLLGAFEDQTINEHGAQIIFSSHESYVLSPLSTTALDPEQVWFTDKNADGVTELTSLAEFHRHRDANVAKRYLTGRYGGTPRLAPSLLSALVTSET
ncbi:ATP/GTP-binding protein [Brachybacterium sp. UMB0905]|uniref:AAA family ATPase n=2 Tax=unclassified Brachybacterium TaxID=2623841 RepID=UPI0013042D87|nr:ATP-binding protein [Brachybacterium sp. UMB0905]